MSTLSPQHVWYLGEGLRDSSGAPRKMVFTADGLNLVVGVEGAQGTRIDVCDLQSFDVETIGRIPGEVRALGSSQPWLAHGLFVDHLAPLGTVHLWNATSLQRECEIPVCSARCNGGAAAGDGTTFAATFNDGTVGIFGLDSASPRVAKHGVQAGAINFSPCGTRLATCAALTEDRSGLDDVRVWCTHTGQLLHTVKGRKSLAAGVALSGAGRLAAVSWGLRGGRGQVSIWDTEARAYRTELPKSQLYYTDLVFSHDSQQLATTCGWAVEVWDPETGERRHLCLDPSTTKFFSSLCVAFSPNGEHLACGGSDGNLRIWKLHSG